MERLFQGAISDLSQRFELPKGLKIGGIFISFSGVNAGGATAALTDLGTVQILKNGQQVDLWDFEKMHRLNNLTGGAPALVSAVGAGFYFAAMRSSYLFQDEKDNCLFTDPSQKWELIHNFPLCVPGLIASGTVRYFAEVADNSAFQHNLIRYNNHSFTAGGAGTFSFTIRQDNVRALMIENDAALTSLSIMKDGKPFVNMINREDIAAQTQIRHRIETYSATTPYLFVDLNPSGEEVGSLSDSVECVFNVSAGLTLEIMAISQDMTPNAAQATAEVRNSHLNAKTTAKQIKGLTTVASRVQAEKV